MDKDENHESLVALCDLPVTTHKQAAETSGTVFNITKG